MKGGKKKRRKEKKKKGRIYLKKRKKMIYEILCLKIKLKIKIPKRQLPRDTLIGAAAEGPRTAQFLAGSPWQPWAGAGCC